MNYLTIDTIAALAWIANLGAIEMHPWYSRCTAPTQPDYLVIDLDPVQGVGFAKVRTAALAVKDALDAWSFPAFIKASGASGMHLYLPITRGPSQREVHATARDICIAIGSRNPRLFTTEYRIANRPRGLVLLDFNQSAPGHTSAGPYSVRPTLHATVSAPVDWDDIAAGIVPRDLMLATVPPRLARDGDVGGLSPLSLTRQPLVMPRSIPAKMN